jgi:curved DNA-binding protein CbpA
MNNCSLINPYRLFGLDSKSTLEQLRKAYYKMALLCHPDKGGTEDDMNIIHNAYIYIKDQLENCKEEKEYEKMEEDFKDFCKKQTDKPPPFRDIWELSDDKKFHDEFNQQFMKLYHTTNSVEELNPFEEGYGNLMDNSEYHDNDNKTNYNDVVKGTPQVEFKRDMIIYEEPTALPDTYGKYQNLNIKKIEDYSDGMMSDYLKSYCEPEQQDIKIKERTLEDIIKEREELLCSTSASNKPITNTK